MSNCTDIIYHIKSHQEYCALYTVLMKLGFQIFYDSLKLEHVVILPSDKTCKWYQGTYVCSNRSCLVMPNFKTTVDIIKRCTSV